jgi:septal ring factor EnvC (AmiA/AmiB activator)
MKLVEADNKWLKEESQSAKGMSSFFLRISHLFGFFPSLLFSASLNLFSTLADLLMRSQAVIRQAHDIESLQKSNAALREELNAAQKASEELVAEATNLASQEVENLKRQLADSNDQNRRLLDEIQNRDNTITGMKLEASAHAAERKAVDDKFLGKFSDFLFDYHPLLFFPPLFHPP